MNTCAGCLRPKRRIVNEKRGLCMPCCSWLSRMTTRMQDGGAKRVLQYVEKFVEVPRVRVSELYEGGHVRELVDMREARKSVVVTRKKRKYA